MCCPIQGVSQQVATRLVVPLACSGDTSTVAHVTHREKHSYIQYMCLSLTNAYTYIHRSPTHTHTLTPPMATPTQVIM